MFFRWNVGMVKVSGLEMEGEWPRVRGKIQFTMNNNSITP